MGDSLKCRGLHPNHPDDSCEAKDTNLVSWIIYRLSGHISSSNRHYVTLWHAWSDGGVRYVPIIDTPSRFLEGSSNALERLFGSSHQASRALVNPSSGLVPPFDLTQCGAIESMLGH